MNSDYAVIIAARMGSERLPGKVLAQYAPGLTNLEQIVRRWQCLSRRQPTVVVFTPSGSEDDPIAAACKRLGVPCFRGNSDVVASMDGAIQKHAPSAMFVARALADNPLVDVGLADWRMDVLYETKADGLWYGGDETRITYAGTTDVWSRMAWDQIAERSTGDEREHPGLYLWNNMSRFAIVQLPLPPREYLARVRTELDTDLDLEMLKAVWSKIGAKSNGGIVPTLDALDLLAKHPDLAAINAGVAVKTQSRAMWKKGMHWGCRECNHRVASIVSGDLEVRCPRCGRPQKFYAQPPNPYRSKPSRMGY